MKRIALAVAVIVTIGFGIYLLNFTSQEKDVIQQPVSQDQAPSQQVTLPTNLYNLTGSIRIIGKDSLTFEAKIPEIMEDNQLTYRLENRTVNITPSTRVTRLVFISEGVGRKRPQETEIDFHDLQKGDSIEVISNRDVRGEQNIIATQVRLLPR